jgi:hypothetical protein
MHGPCSFDRLFAAPPHMPSESILKKKKIRVIELNKVASRIPKSRQIAEVTDSRLPLDLSNGLRSPAAAPRVRNQRSGSSEVRLKFEPYGRSSSGNCRRRLLCIPPSAINAFDQQPEHQGGHRQKHGHNYVGQVVLRRDDH